MGNQQYESIVKNLVDIIKIEPSKLSIESNRPYTNFWYDNI